MIANNMVGNPVVNNIVMGILVSIMWTWIISKSLKDRVSTIAAFVGTMAGWFLIDVIRYFRG